MSQSTFGLRVMGDKNLVKRLRNGADIRLSTVARIEAVLSETSARPRRSGDGDCGVASRHHPTEGAKQSA